MKETQEKIRMKILDFLNTHGFQCSEGTDYTKALLSLFDLNRKWIPTQKRAVVYSKELKDKIKNNLSNDIVDLIRFFEAKFNNGENINNHLSRNIFLFENYDKLLNQWNIHHLHLNGNDAKATLKCVAIEAICICSFWLIQKKLISWIVFRTLMVISLQT